MDEWKDKPEEGREHLRTESREVTTYKEKLEELTRQEKGLCNRVPLPKAENKKMKHLQKKSRDGYTIICCIISFNFVSLSQELVNPSMDLLSFVCTRLLCLTESFYDEIKTSIGDSNEQPTSISNDSSGMRKLKREEGIIILIICHKDYMVLSSVLYSS